VVLIFSRFTNNAGKKTGGKMKRIKLAAIFAITVMFFVSVSKANIFDDFKNMLQEQYMKPFARDIGGLIGSADFHSGKTAGFPGFNISVYVNGQTAPETDNEILKQADVDFFGVPVVAVTLGLPFNFEATARGVGYAGYTLIGGGIKWGILQGNRLFPDVKVGAYYDIFDHEYLKMQHWSVFASASLNLPIIKPYVGVGMDQTKLETKVVSVAGPLVIPGSTVTVTEPRFTAGANMTLLPMIQVFAAYHWLHGSTGFQAGASIGF
jgi:hypothetical protein